MSLPESFDQMVDAHRVRIYRAACLLLDDPHEAEDITQLVFTEAWRGWERFEERSGAFTWLYTILRRTCARQRRRSWWRLLRNREPKETADAALEALPADELSPREEACASEKQRDVRLLLRKLSPPLREILVLRYLEEFSVPQIADALGIPKGTVKSRLHYALRVAARHWAPEQS